jgi:putative ATPase
VEGKVANMQCLPENLKDRTYYHPTNEGIEKRIRDRMEEIKKPRGAQAGSETSHPKEKS